MSLAESGFRLLIAKAVSTVVLFIGLAYFARELSPALMGSFFLFRVLNDGAGLLSDFGMRRGVEKRISEKERPSEALSAGFVMKLTSALVFALIIIVFRDIINGYLGVQLALLLSFSVVAREIGWFGVHVLRGELRVRETAIIEASRLIVWVCVGTVLVELGYGVRGVVYGFIAGLLSLGLLAFLRIDTPFGYPSVESGRSILSFSKYDFVSNVGDYIYNWIDIGIIGIFLMQSAVGIYEYAWQVTLPVALVVETTTVTIFPQVSRWHESKSTEEIRRTIHRAIEIGLFISIPMLFGALLFAESILSLLFGPIYASGAVVMMILMAEKVVRTVQSVLNITLRGMDMPEVAALATGITVIANLIMNFVFIPVYGIVGAAAATFFSICLSGVIHWWYLDREISISLPLRFVSRVAVVSAVMFLLLSVVKARFPIGSITELVIIVFAGTLVYLGGSMASLPLRERIIYPGLEVISDSVRGTRD